jgi:hypothetical protein
MARRKVNEMSHTQEFDPEGREIIHLRKRIAELESDLTARVQAEVAAALRMAAAILGCSGPWQPPMPGCGLSHCYRCKILALIPADGQTALSQMQGKEQKAGADMALAWLTASLNSGQPIGDFWCRPEILQQLKTALDKRLAQARLEAAEKTLSHPFEDCIDARDPVRCRSCDYVAALRAASGEPRVVKK